METTTINKLEDTIHYIKLARACLISISDNEYFKLFTGIIDAPLTDLTQAENSILAALHSENY
jgi:hypothetical protein